MSEQTALFETPREQSARQYNEQLDAYMSAREVAGGYQCQDCGGVSRNQARYWGDHGIMGTRCQAERFAYNHTLYDFRNGDRDRYIGSTARLRAIGVWRHQQRPDRTTS